MAEALPQLHNAKHPNSCSSHQRWWHQLASGCCEMQRYWRQFICFRANQLRYKYYCCYFDRQKRFCFKSFVQLHFCRRRFLSHTVKCGTNVDNIIHGVLLRCFLWHRTRRNLLHGADLPWRATHSWICYWYVYGYDNYSQCNNPIPLFRLTLGWLCVIFFNIDHICNIYWDFLPISHRRNNRPDKLVNFLLRIL